MRRVLIGMTLISSQIFGATMIDGYKIEGFIMPKKPQLEMTITNQKSAISGRAISINSLLVSEKNEFTVGKVIKHKLGKRFSNLPIFVVGKDDYSIRWVKENAEYLKKIQAIGILTNVESAAILASFEQQTDLTVTTTSIRGLSKHIGTRHYPFLIYNNWVIQ